MMRVMGIVGLLVFAATLHRVAVADEPKAGKAAPPDPTAQLLAKLRQPITLPAQKEMTFAEFAAAVEKATGVTVVVNEGAFRSNGGATEDLDTVPPLRPLHSKKVAAATALRQTLAQQAATYLVRRDHVEIVPIAYALKESRQPAKTDANGDEVVAQPLVSAVLKNVPLGAALDDLAADHDLTVILSPKAGDQQAAFVTARLLNVPADKAVELLALQADLRVVRRGPAFLVTTQEHSDQLNTERNDRERQRIELENLRYPGGLGVLGQPPGGAICGFTGNVGMAGNLGNGGRGNAGCVPGGQISGFGLNGIGGFGIGGSGFGGIGVNGFGIGSGISGNGFGGNPAPGTPPAGGR